MKTGFLTDRFQQVSDYFDQKRRNLKARVLGMVMSSGLDGNFEAAERWRSVADFLRKEGDDKPTITAQKKRMHHILERSIAMTDDASTPEALHAAIQDELDSMLDDKTKAADIVKYAKSLPDGEFERLVKQNFQPSPGLDPWARSDADEDLEKMIDGYVEEFSESLSAQVAEKQALEEVGIPYQKQIRMTKEEKEKALGKLPHDGPSLDEAVPAIG